MGPKSNQVPAPFGPCHLWTRAAITVLFPQFHEATGAQVTWGQRNREAVDALTPGLMKSGTIGASVADCLPASLLPCRRDSLASCDRAAVEAAVIDSEALI
jgi:hypothetical protein